MRRHFGRGTTRKRPPGASAGSVLASLEEAELKQTVKQNVKQTAKQTKQTAPLS
jgi:hypothetical protein